MILIFLSLNIRRVYVKIVNIHSWRFFKIKMTMSNLLNFQVALVHLGLLVLPAQLALQVPWGQKEAMEAQEVQVPQVCKEELANQDQEGSMAQLVQ